MSDEARAAVSALRLRSVLANNDRVKQQGSLLASWARTMQNATAAADPMDKLNAQLAAAARFPDGASDAAAREAWSALMTAVRETIGRVEERATQNAWKRNPPRDGATRGSADKARAALQTALEGMQAFTSNASTRGKSLAQVRVAVEKLQNAIASEANAATAWRGLVGYAAHVAARMGLARARATRRNHAQRERGEEVAAAHAAAEATDSVDAVQEPHSAAAVRVRERERQTQAEEAERRRAVVRSAAADLARDVVSQSYARAQERERQKLAKEAEEAERQRAAALAADAAEQQRAAAAAIELRAQEAAD